jgi:hypothetical protein
MCDQLCRSHRVIPDGAAVRGAYHGHAFTGVVLSHRGGLHFCLPEYRIRVDVPFLFMGQGEPRTEVRIDINDTLPLRGLRSRTSLEVIPQPPGSPRTYATQAPCVECQIYTHQRVPEHQGDGSFDDVAMCETCWAALCGGAQ